MPDEAHASLKLVYEELTALVARQAAHAESSRREGQHRHRLHALVLGVATLANAAVQVYERNEPLVSFKSRALRASLSLLSLSVLTLVLALVM